MLINICQHTKMSTKFDISCTNVVIKVYNVPVVNI